MKLIKNLPRRLSKSGRLESWALFKCSDCLQEVERYLSSGKIAKSCGCVQYKLSAKAITKHGGKGTRLYHIWTQIKQRIFNPKNCNYPNYGGRGITICPEWANDYIVFRDWALNNGYLENLQINRIENEDNYEPSNCNFVTAKENARNRRGQKIKNIEIANEIRVLYNTGNYTQKELAIKYGVHQGNISLIINNTIWKN